MPHEERSLNTRHVGRRILFFDPVDSTNSVAAGLADDPANDGVAVLAAEQTAGRGQHGRRWQCRPGDGVLLSVLLFPPPALRRPAVLTAWAAVAVCETVHALTGLQARIKWPNDVLLRGRKVCGILIEQGRAAVVGVGLNVRQPAEYFAEAGLPHGASLAQFTDADLDVRSAAEALLRRVDEEYGRLLDGDLATLETSWKRHVGLLGRDVIAERYDGPTHHGRLVDSASTACDWRRRGRRRWRCRRRGCGISKPLEPAHADWCRRTRSRQDAKDARGNREKGIHQLGHHNSEPCLFFSRLLASLASWRLFPLAQRIPMLVDLVQATTRRASARRRVSVRRHGVRPRRGRPLSGSRNRRQPPSPPCSTPSSSTARGGLCGPARQHPRPRSDVHRRHGEGGRRQGAAEIMDDCRHDLAAWLDWLRQRVGPHVGLLGHSLGAVKCLYASAHDAGLAPPASRPCRRLGCRTPGSAPAPRGRPSAKPTPSPCTTLNPVNPDR